VGTLYHKQ